MRFQVRSECVSRCVQNEKVARVACDALIFLGPLFLKKWHFWGRFFLKSGIFGVTGTDRLRSVKPAHASAAKQLKKSRHKKIDF
jgi:hypothetical protein